MRYTIVLTPEPDGSAINVTVPALPGCLTWGRTHEEAIASAREAIVLHLEGYAERGIPVPPDRPRHPAVQSRFGRARALDRARRRLPAVTRRRARPQTITLEVESLAPRH